jgi:tetratricopeptide (TPR) repeat protein
LNLAKVYYSMALNDSTYLEKAYATVDTLIAKTDEKDESYANVLALSGQIMVKRGMREEAMRIFEKLLLVDPTTHEDVERAGNEFLANRDWENGAIFMQMAIDARKKTNSEDFESYFNLGVAYFNAKNYPKAVESYLAALDIDPENKQGSYSLLLAYYQSELFDDAILQGQKYAEKYPDDPNGWRILSLSYSKKGMKLKAEEAAKKYQDLQ